MRKSPWRSSVLATILTGMLASPPPSARGDEAAVRERLRASSRWDKNGWIFLHLEGPPEHLGFQHGYWLAPEIDDLLRVLKPFLKHATQRDWEFFRLAGERMLWKGIEPEYQREIDGIVAGLAARGLGADRWDVVALNAAEELPHYYVPWLDKQQGKVPTIHAPGNCSAFIATGRATRDGRIVMGHNNWSNYVVGARWNVIFDLHPERGLRVLMDGHPGGIASNDDFGINSAGILVTETTITQFEGFDPEGKPEFARARKALQYSQTIDDFVRIMLDKNNGGYANDWLLGDNKTGEIALFEMGLKEHSVRRTKDGAYVGANFPVDPGLIAAETKFDPKHAESSPNARRTRWDQLMSLYQGKIDTEAARRFETDTYDVIDKTEGANERTLCGCVERSPRGVPEWDWGPFYPGGTVQVKVVDAQAAERMEFSAAVGHPGGPDFVAAEFLDRHPEYSWMRGLLRDLKSRPWTRFAAGMKGD